MTSSTIWTSSKTQFKIRNILFKTQIKLFENFFAGINKIIEAEGLELFMLLITDIVKSNSQVIALGKDAGLVEKAYNVKLEDNTVLLEGVVSRKKQVVPIMTDSA